ncbi:MAG: YqaJ viral recombinase family protein [Myxococcota bacterium]
MKHAMVERGGGQPTLGEAMECCGVAIAPDAMHIGARRMARLRAQDRYEWLKIRRDGIGGSDAGALLGVNRHKSSRRVLADKLAEVKARRTPMRSPFGARAGGGGALQFGADIERHVFWLLEKRAQRSALLEGDELGTLVHPEYAWGRANIDGLVLTPERTRNPGEPGVSILEIKHTTVPNKYDAGPPLSYIAQVHYYMWVTGTQRAVIATLVLHSSAERRALAQRARRYERAVGHSRPEDAHPYARMLHQKLRFDVVERDEGMIEELVVTSRAFWSDVTQAVCHDFFASDNLSLFDT